MKKVFLFLIIACVASIGIFAATANASITSVTPKSTFSGMTVTTKNFIIEFDVPITTLTLTTWANEVKEIDFMLLNLTDKPIKILWDSSVYIDPEGSSHRIMHAGIKYIDRDQSMPPSIVPPKGKLDDLIIPTDKVYFTGRTWVVNSFFTPKAGTKFGVMLALEINGKVKYYTFKFVIVKHQKIFTLPHRFEVSAGLGANFVSMFGFHISPKIYGNIQYFLMKDFLVGFQIEYSVPNTFSSFVNAEYRFDIDSIKSFVGLKSGWMFTSGSTIVSIGAYGGVSYPVLSNVSIFLKGGITMPLDTTFSTQIMNLMAGMSFDF